MSIKDLPHVTVEQVLALRKAAIDLEKQLANLKTSLPKVRADAIDMLISEEMTVGRMRNDSMRSFIFVSDARAFAYKLEAGNE